ncbi:MAG: response regulator [Cyclobacteriaceae bacterium]
MKKCLVLVVLVLPFFGYAQSKLDSLKLVTGSLQSDSLRILTYLRLTVDYNRINYDSALVYASKAQDLSRQINSNSLLARSKYRMATVFISQGQVEKAKTELDTVVALSQLQKDTATLLSAQVGLGRLFEKISAYDSAVKVFFEAVVLAEKIGDKNAEARIKNYLASIYNYQSQFDLSIKYYREALVLVRELNFKPGISAILTNLGDNYLSINEYDSALIYQRQALKLKQETNDKLGVGRVYNNLGNIYISTSPLFNLDSGFYCYSRSLNISEEMQDRNLKAQSLYGLIRVYFMKDQYQKARTIGEELIVEAESIQDLPLATRSYGYLSLVSAALGDPMKSISYRERSNALADSLLNSERIKLTQELEAKYQNEAQKKTIELQELQISKRQNERNGLIILAAVVLLVLGLLISRYRIKQAANKQLRELDRIKSTFFENLSHEFRTPLSLIIAPLKDRMNKDISDEDRTLLRSVINSAENLDELIKQLLDLARLEKSNYQLSPKPVEASAFFRVLTASYQSLAEMKQISFSVILPDQELWLSFDPDLIKKVCNNLLSNAFKFTPDKGEVTFEVQFYSQLVIRVSDSGSGIPSDEQNRIFDRFYQVEGPQASGSGIGLALTKELVLQAGGEISLNSPYSHGTCFKVTLPLQKVAPSTAEEYVIPQKLESEQVNGEVAFSADKQNLLVIEDNADLRSYLTGLFQDQFNVYTATNGQEGINIAIESIPDIVVSDIMMDGMNGLEVCKTLKSDEKTDHIPVILLTARSDQQTKLDGIQYGADAYIIKPFEPEELRVTSTNLIATRRKLREKYSGDEKSSNEAPAKLPFVIKCEAVVQKNLSNDTFDIDDFTREIGMSRMQLHRKLTALTGFSATAFVRHYRLNQAKMLLEKGEPVSQVAYAVGFASLPYFTKSFKEKYGFVPSEVVKKASHVT